VPSIPNAFGFLRFVARRWNEDRCPQIAASLTYTTLLALVPVFAIAVALLSSLPFFEAVMVRLKIFLLLNLVPEIAGRIITVYMEQFVQNAGRLTVIGFGALFVTTIVVFYTVDSSINAIWRVRKSRPWWMSIAAYTGMLALGPLLLGVSVSVTTYLYALSDDLRGLPAEAQPVLLKLVPVLVTTLTFFLTYSWVPQRHVPWRHALAGGFLAAAVFEAMKEGFALYISLAPTYDLIYGAFAALPIFLLWVYLSWLVVLFGAEVTACAGYWRAALWKRAPTPGALLRDALAIGRRLGRDPGRFVEFERLRLEIPVPVAELEDVLGQLVDAGLVRREGRGRYALARSPQDILVGELYRATVAPGVRIEAGDWSDVSPDLSGALERFEALLERPLAEAIADPA